MNNYFPDISIFACGISKNVLICDLVILAIVTTSMAMFILSHIFLFIKKIVKKESIEKIFIIDGRLSRSDFIIWNIALFLQLLLILFPLDGEIQFNLPLTGIYKVCSDLSNANLLISFVFITILMIKRAHDCNILGEIIILFDGLLFLFYFFNVPVDTLIFLFFGLTSLLIFGFLLLSFFGLEGSKEANLYGEKPKTYNYLKFTGIFCVIVYFFAHIQSFLSLSGE